VRLPLADFGTGVSSLSTLGSLPFDVIKIDRSFVTDIHSNAESAAIVRAVSTLAGALKIPVCVEGIETEADHGAVLGLGCAVGQGWYFGKPMPGEHAVELLAQRRDQEPEAPRTAAAG
jgi:EAL domain-containing protein (putative c-di-GMP-specific phosphodiesterase class I)